MIYIFVFLLLVFLSFYFDVCQYNRNRNLWYYGIMVLLILIAGFRYRLGVDTTMYIDNYYDKVNTLDNMSFEDISIKYLLWDLLNSIVRTLNCHFYIVQFIQSFLVNFLIFKYVKRHGKYLFTFVLFYYLWFYTSFNMEIMKASISIVICLYGNDYILEKKWIKGYSLYILACLFHFSTGLILLTPFLFSLRLNKKSIIVLIMMFVGGYVLQKTMGSYIEIFEFSDDIYTKAESYSYDERYNDSKGLSFYILDVLPIIAYVIYSLVYLKKGNGQYSLFIEPLILIGIAFEAVRANVEIFYRYAMFYYVYIALILSHVYVSYARRLVKETFTSYLIASFIFVPLIIVFLHQYPRKYFRYYPYYSVFDRKTDSMREKLYHENRPYRDAARSDRY